MPGSASASRCRSLSLFGLLQVAAAKDPTAVVAHGAMIALQQSQSRLLRIFERLVRQRLPREILVSHFAFKAMCAGRSEDSIKTTIGKIDATFTVFVEGCSSFAPVWYSLPPLRSLTVGLSQFFRPRSVIVVILLDVLNDRGGGEHDLSIGFERTAASSGLQDKFPAFKLADGGE
jgi:hypothetical protein